MKNYSLLITLIFFIIFGCKEPGGQIDFEKEKYIAHLKLDSSTLIITEVFGDLNVPWEITYGSDSCLWFTEHKGTVTRLNPESGEKKLLLQVPDVHYVKSRGLLGMAVHPDIKKEPYIYLHYTFSIEKEDNLEDIRSRLVRYTYTGDTLTDVKIILDSIPGKTLHNGSRLVISPDRKLFFAIGDIGETSLPQDINHLNGKNTPI
jgi:glucose/arabinose dehydrogenase